LWPAEGTSQPVTISKKCKNPSSALRRTRTCVQALLLCFVATTCLTFVGTWTQDDGWDWLLCFHAFQLYLICWCCACKCIWE
jgi:hypothetical protein